MFKKIIYSLLLTTLIVNTTYAEEKDTIDIPVKVEFETVDHKTYTDIPDTVDIRMSYIDDQANMKDKYITLNKEDNFQTLIKNLPKEISSYWRQDIPLAYSEETIPNIIHFLTTP